MLQCQGESLFTLDNKIDIKRRPFVSFSRDKFDAQAFSFSLCH